MSYPYWQLTKPQVERLSPYLPQSHDRRREILVASSSDAPILSPKVALEQYCNNQPSCAHETKLRNINPQ